MIESLIGQCVRCGGNLTAGHQCIDQITKLVLKHDCKVESTERGFRSVCSCGWMGRETDRMSDDYAYTNADDDRKQHVRKHK